MLDVVNAYYAMRIHMKLHEREQREQQERRRYTNSPPPPKNEPQKKQTEPEVND